MSFKQHFSDLEARAILASRERMPPALELFRPQPYQEGFIEAMSRNMVLEVMLGGGNQSGKSLCAAASVAAMIMNQSITFNSGEKIQMRPERWRNEAMKIWIVGFDWDHLGKTIYRLLFMPGAFRILRDQETGKWRAWDPTRPGEPDLEKTRPAPAFIPMEAIAGGEDGISWENKKEHQPNSMTMAHDETVVQFFPSTADRAPQGDPAHLIWLDEHIHDESWYSELIIRLRIYRGRLLWTAWADTAPSSNIMEACERAEKQQGKPEQKSFSFSFSGEASPFGDPEHDAAIYDTMDEETRQARASGTPSNARWRVFARFSPYIHRALPQEERDDDPLAAAIRKCNGIPGDWTRYMILDPGTQHAAVLFVAIPPPKLWAAAGDFVVPYDEFYVPRASAKTIAEAVAKRCAGVTIEDIIADPHACRQTPMGFSMTIGQNYEREFRTVNFGSRRHGSRMTYGSDDVDSRILMAQGSLNIRADGSVRLRILGCTQLCRQMERYRWERGADRNPTNKPAKYQRIDLCHAIEYFLSRSDCGYFKPPVIVAETDHNRQNVMKSLNNIFGRSGAARPGDTSVYCGAGGPFDNSVS
jgi:hypothetical protein